MTSGEMAKTQKAAAQSRQMPRVAVTGMPLAMAEPAKRFHVAAIRGRDDTRRFLINLGFVEGSEVTLISEMNGNVIVNVKGTRVAISKAMASRILVD